MKIRVVRRYLHGLRFANIGEEYEIDDKEGYYLIENGFAIRVDEPETIGVQIGLDSPAFGHNDVPLKKMKKGKARKNA